MSAYSEKTEPVIGLDFGNCFSFPCYIPDLDTASRLGGTPRDLLPASSPNGYPSVFFYSKSAAEKARQKGVQPPPWCGANAMRMAARPEDHRVRNLKRHLSQPLTLDDWSGGYDEAIVQLIQYLVREANKVLKMEWMLTSNRISLAYPATYTRAQCRHLKDLAERAALEDGRHVEVAGMIAEPAAAALDYLVDHQHLGKEMTVLTYDLGGGTFDLAIVSVYPQGRKRPNGETYYFDIEATGGIGDLGGNEFDEVMCGLIRSKIPAGIQVVQDFRVQAEAAKIELSSQKISEPPIQSTEGDLLDITITRAEFMEKALPLIRRTIDATRAMLEAHQDKAPERIILTGAASQMPLIKQELERTFPKYYQKVISYRPSRAVAYGAARYGTPNGLPGDSGAVQQRAPRDLGVRFYKGQTHFIDVYIPAGSPLPFCGEYEKSYTRIENQRYSRFVVYEAKVTASEPAVAPANTAPDILEIDRHFTAIMEVTLDRGAGTTIPIGTPTESRMSLDKDGLLVIEARDPTKPGSPPVRNECRLKNLS